jgi:hypothetical protein
MKNEEEKAYRTFVYLIEKVAIFLTRSKSKEGSREVEGRATNR